MPCSVKETELKTCMNVVVKTKISYILERGFN